MSYLYLFTLRTGLQFIPVHVLWTHLKHANRTMNTADQVDPVTRCVIGRALSPERERHDLLRADWTQTPQQTRSVSSEQRETIFAGIRHKLRASFVRAL